MRKRRERCEPPPSNFLPPASPCFWSAGPYWVCALCWPMWPVLVCVLVCTGRAAAPVGPCARPDLKPDPQSNLGP